MLLEVFKQENGITRLKILKAPSCVKKKKKTRLKENWGSSWEDVAIIQGRDNGGLHSADSNG